MEASRRAVFPPEESLQQFLVRPDMVIADIGCGPGFYSVPAAQMLPQGRVYAVDRQIDMLEWTKKRAAEASVTNLTTVKSPAEDLPLESKSLDAVFMANVLHDLNDQDKALSEVKRVLKPGGLFFLVEWDKVDIEFGPPIEIRFSPEELEALLRKHNFLDIHFIPAHSPWYQLTAITPEG